MAVAFTLTLLSGTGTKIANAETPVGVYTARMDNARTAANTHETQLKPSNVNPQQFGKLFSYKTDGLVWAQPLIVPGVSIPNNGVHNLLIVATDFGTVYAFDADSNAGANATPLWTKSLSAPPDMANYWPGTTGVVGTPVIDPDTGTLYAISQREENGTRVVKLHALDIRTGDEKFGGPVLVAASVRGNGYGAVNGELILGTNVKHRTGLLLLNGVVYLVTGAYQEDASNPATYPQYHGWVLGYDATTLQQTGALCVTPNGQMGGIWMSGAAPAADADGYIYMLTGNGTFSADTGGIDYGDSIVKVGTTGGLAVVDYATPMNQNDMNIYDSDLGAGGPVVMDDPDTGKHFVLGLSKDGTLFMSDRNNLGHYSPANNNGFAQTIPAITPFGSFTTPALWNNSIYISGYNDKTRMFSYSNGQFATTPSSISEARIGNPSAYNAISANGNQDGILWVLDPSNQIRGGPVVLRAYDANDLSKELYDSDMNAARDSVVQAIEFTAPTVANGKVYIAGAWQVAAYGLLPVVYGDANGDGSVDTADVIQVLSTAAGLSNPANIVPMDVSPAVNGVAGDGVVDMRDAVSLLNHVRHPDATPWP